MKIGTGEGKSVTLAVTCIVLALLGSTVNCACYSDYLSERDFNSFSTLFEDFGVLDYISYGTFNKLCEDFINETGNIRDLVYGKILGQSVNFGRKTPDGRPKILLIDEVDVFFNKDFYGNM